MVPSLLAENRSGGKAEVEGRALVSAGRPWMPWAAHAAACTASWLKKEQATRFRVSPGVTVRLMDKGHTGHGLCVSTERAVAIAKIETPCKSPHVS